MICSYLNHLTHSLYQNVFILSSKFAHFFQNENVFIFSFFTLSLPLLACWLWFYVYTGGWFYVYTYTHKYGWGPWPKINKSNFSTCHPILQPNLHQPLPIKKDASSHSHLTYQKTSCTLYNTTILSHTLFPKIHTQIEHKHKRMQIPIILLRKIIQPYYISFLITFAFSIKTKSSSINASLLLPFSHSCTIKIASSNAFFLSRSKVSESLSLTLNIF